MCLVVRSMTMNSRAIATLAEPDDEPDYAQRAALAMQVLAKPERRQFIRTVYEFHHNNLQTVLHSALLTVLPQVRELDGPSFHEGRYAFALSMLAKMAVGADAAGVDVAGADAPDKLAGTSPAPAEPEDPETIMKDELRRSNARLQEKINSVLEQHPELRDATDEIAIKQDTQGQVGAWFLDRIQANLQERARAIIERRPDLEHLFDD
jgi:hypothetical protein